jgi:amino acid transporter
MPTTRGGESGGGLKKTLGLAALTFYGTGMILGAGVYSVVGAAAGEAGDGLWLTFVISAVAALFTGLSYAEMATMHPNAGAEYAYLGKAFPKRRLAAFVVGLMVACLGAATAATVSLAFAGYLSAFFEAPSGLVALGLLGAATTLGIVGIKESSWVNILFTLVEASGLVLVIYAAVTGTETFGDAVSSPPGAGVLPGAALIFFSYLGFENIANLSEEAKDPGRHIPRAILISLAVTTTLYVALALAVVALLPPGELAASDSPLATAVGSVSPKLARALGGIALFATANTALIAMVAASRMLFAMSRAGDLPKKLAAVASGRGSPWASSLLIFALAASLLLLGKVEAVASVASFGALTAFMAVHLAVIVLRYRSPGGARPFRVPLTIKGCPVLPVAGMVVTGALMTQFDGVTYAVVGGIVAAAVGLYFARRQSAAR